MNNKLTLCLGLLLPFILSSCAPSFEVEKDNTYSKSTGIKICRIKNNWVRSTSGIEIAFDLIKSTQENGNSDYFLKVTSQGLADFAIGKYLVLTVDGKSEKFRVTRTAAFGKYARLSFPDVYSTTAAVRLDESTVAAFVHAYRIQFSLQGQPALTPVPAEIEGVFSNENIANMERFKTSCMNR